MIGQDAKFAGGVADVRNNWGQIPIHLALIALVHVQKALDAIFNIAINRPELAMQPLTGVSGALV
jgi:hypothetical protein